jgi:alkylation response protein AidB-like acyl-CoA dehydrogenase
MADDDIAAMISDSATAYAVASGSVARARARYGSGAPLDRAAWAEMAQSGWVSMLLAESKGGGGMGLGEAAALHQALGKGLVPEPLALTAHLPNLVLNQNDTSSIGDPDQPVAVAWQGGHGTLFAEHTGLSLTDGRLSGEALNVIGAEAAGTVIAAVRERSGTGLFALPAGAFRQAPFRLADGTSGAHLIAEGIDISKAIRLFPAADGARILDRALDEVRVILAAELLGVMRQTFTLTLEYLRTRKQFGRAIGSNQALQHRAVDLYVQIELTEAAVRLAVEQMAAGDDPSMRAAAASAAKARASEAALTVAREAVQLHGAIAYTLEHDICLYLARSLTLAALLGNAAAHRRRYAALTASAA